MWLCDQKTWEHWQLSSTEKECEDAFEHVGWNRNVCCLFFWEKYDVNSFLVHQQPKFSKEEPFLYSPPHRLSVPNSYHFHSITCPLTPVSLRLYWVPGRRHRNMSHVPSDKELTIWTDCPFHILYVFHSICQALMRSLLWTWHTPYWVRAHSGNHFFLASSSKTYFVTDPRTYPIYKPACLY